MSVTATPALRRAARGLRLMWWAWLAHMLIYVTGITLWQRVLDHSSTSLLGTIDAAMTGARIAVWVLAVIVLFGLARARVSRWAKLAFGMHALALVVEVIRAWVTAYLSHRLGVEAMATVIEWLYGVGLVTLILCDASLAAALASLARVRGTVRPGWVLASAALGITVSLGWALATMLGVNVWRGPLAWAHLGSGVLVFIPSALIVWLLSSPRGLADSTPILPRTLGPEWRRAVNGLDTYSLALWLKLGLLVGGFMAVVLSWWFDSVDMTRAVVLVALAADIFLSLAFVVGLIGWASIPRATSASGYVKASVVLSALLIVVQIALVVFTLRKQSDGFVLRGRRKSPGPGHAKARGRHRRIFGLAAVIALLGSFRLATLAVGEGDLAQRATRLWLGTLVLAFVVLGFRWILAVGVLQPAKLFVTVAVFVLFLAATLFGSVRRLTPRRSPANLARPACLKKVSEDRHGRDRRGLGAKDVA